MQGDLWLRPARPQESGWIRDLTMGQLGRILAEAWDDATAAARMVEQMQSAGTTLAVQADGDTAGFVYFITTRPGRLHVGALVLSPAHQGRGIGSRVFDLLANWALRAGLSELELWVETNNPRALSLYRRLGFVPTGRPRVNTLEMRKSLHPPADRLQPIALLHAMSRAARAAGEVVREAYELRRALSGLTRRNLPSEAEAAAEQALQVHLQSHAAEFGLVTRRTGESAGGRDHTWLVGALHGADNLWLGIPYLATSVTLLRGGRPWLGVVYQPLQEELYVAEANPGAAASGGVGTAGGAGGASAAWLNCRPLVPAAVEAADGDGAGDTGLQGATVAWLRTGPGHGTSAAEEVRRRLEARARRMLQTWAPALDLCLLARGDITALAGDGIAAEDVAAGALAATAAGCPVTDWRGAPWQPGSRQVLGAATAALHQQLLSIVATEA